MRILLVFVALALAAPHVEAGEFIARQPKAQPAAPAPAVKSRSKAKPVRRITRTASKPKKSKKHDDSEWKRPMP